jgi:hypothetical protein
MFAIIRCGVILPQAIQHDRNNPETEGLRCGVILPQAIQHDMNNPEM